MDLQTRKLNLITYLAGLQDESFFAKIEDYIFKKKQKTEKEFTPFSEEELLNRVEKSQKDLENGRCKTQDELEKISEFW
ncbi:MAG: hypothetical protein QM564_05700 [Bergeyella sp.]